MASQEVVSCPGCGKRYSVPPGVPPGQFQCQDCSAVVPYGAAPAAASAPARPQGGGASARKHARAAAAKRRLERERQDDEDYDDDRRARGHGGRARQHNPVYYVLAFVVLGALAAGIAFLHQKGKEEDRRKAEAQAAREREQAEAKAARDAAYAKRAAEEDAAAAAAAAAENEARMAREAAAARRAGDAPPPRSGGIKAAPRSDAVITGSGPVKFVDNPPTGGNYGKSQSEILIMLKKDRSSVVGELGHLPDTPSDLQGRIDADVAHIANPNAGGEAMKAQERLVGVGRAAIPRVLAVFSRLDFSKYKDMASARDVCVVAASVDQVLREITGYTTPPRLHFTPDGSIENYPLCAEEWYVWWLTVGYRRETFYKTAPEKETEEKL